MSSVSDQIKIKKFFMLYSAEGGVFVLYFPFSLLQDAAVRRAVSAQR